MSAGAVAKESMRSDVLKELKKYNLLEEEVFIEVTKQFTVSVSQELEGDLAKLYADDSLKGFNFTIAILRTEENVDADHYWMRLESNQQLAHAYKATLKDSVDYICSYIIKNGERSVNKKSTTDMKDVECIVMGTNLERRNIELTMGNVVAYVYHNGFYNLGQHFTYTVEFEVDGEMLDYNYCKSKNEVVEDIKEAYRKWVK